VVDIADTYLLMGEGEATTDLLTATGQMGVTSVDLLAEQDDDDNLLLLLRC